ncbi:hypothetical protein CPter91_4053 [Collimonas pratensis]|uniref:Uncharacterized protein n=1 Tax=Collimonas pratensis TaxID=279113 RepID=A0A127Q8K1_9BURK|nr:hypothetical protein CPter91_4053 [Collimonas pratensis]
MLLPHMYIADILAADNFRAVMQQASLHSVRRPNPTVGNGENHEKTVSSGIARLLLCF